MGWVPDHIWFASKGKGGATKGSGTNKASGSNKGSGNYKASGNKGKGGGNWVPDHIWYASKGQGKGGSKGTMQSQWQKKGFSKGTSSAPIKNTVPADFKVNTNMKYHGIVTGYWKLKGYGWITLDKKGVVPEDRVFVYWEDIQSADRFPSLDKDMKVQFQLKKEEARGKTTVCAKAVTLPGGGAIEMQDDNDAKKQFVGGQFLRYSGTLKFFLDKKGFGYVTIDEGYDYAGEDVPKEIRVELAEMNAGGKQPAVMKDVQVEFGIWKTEKGIYKAYNMTAPGGEPLPSK